jgi:hypothetical protein
MRLMAKTLVLTPDGRVVLGEVEGEIDVKAFRQQRFDESAHPRDRKGRFIEVGAKVSIFGGGSGIVQRNAGYGRIDVLRADGKIVRVHRNYLTVTDRPDGGQPTSDPDGVAPMPVTPAAAPSTGEPDVEDYEPPDEPAIDLSAPPEAAQSVADAADHDGHDHNGDETDDTPTEYRAPTEFDMSASNLPIAIDKIDKANRRAERAGIPERIGYSVEHYEVTRTSDRDGRVLPVPIVEQRVKVTLDRPTVQHDGWTFVATLTWDEEAGLVTRVAPDATLKARPEARLCDVCKSVRDRKDTYVVQNEDGDEQQVGRNCLQQFMGITPGNLWFLDFDLDTDGDEERESYGSSTRDQRYDTLGILAATAAIVTKRGFVSRGQANVDATKTATADVLFEFMSGGFEKSKSAEDRAFDAEIKAMLPDMQERAQQVRDYARTLDGDSEYVVNLRAVSGADSVDRRNVPLLASAVSSLVRREEQVAAQKATSPTGSQHFGEVGGKIANVEARVVGVRRIEGDYGITTLLTFVTKDGNVAKWFASGNFEDDVKIGDEVLLTGGTIKGHGEFRGVPETTLTRVKFREAGAAGDAAAAEEERRKAAEKVEAAAARKAAKVAVPEGMTAWPGGDAMPSTGMTIRIAREKPKGSHETVIAEYGSLTSHYAFSDRDAISVRSTEPGSRYHSFVVPLDTIVAYEEGTGQGPLGSVREYHDRKAREKAEQEAARIERERVAPIPAYNLKPGNEVVVDGVEGTVVAVKNDGRNTVITLRLPDGTEVEKTVTSYASIPKAGV